MESLTLSLSRFPPFCNAGFDNFGGDSMMGFQTDWLVNLTLSALIITGGLGFMVWFDLVTKARNQSGRRTLRFHTKVVLWLTAAILLFWDSNQPLDRV